MELVCRIEHDLDPESPRQWDNLGTMVCWHRRYNLGDEQPSESAVDYRKSMALDLDPGLEQALESVEEHYADKLCQLMDQGIGAYSRRQMEVRQECESEYSALIDEVLDTHYVTLPLYLYDHSGLTISTGSFSCPWDSGQAGFIYLSLEKAAENWSCPKDWDHVLTHYDPPRTLRQAAQDVLEGEVRTYDQYLTGDVWGYTIEDEDGNLVDSCWGFYGEDYCRQEAESAMKYYQQKEAA